MKIIKKNNHLIFILFPITVGLFLTVSCHVKPEGNRSGQVFELTSVLTGEETYYDRYEEFHEGFYKRSPGEPYEPLEEFKADSKGGKLKYSEYIYEAGICSVVFSWEFGEDIREVEAGEDISVTLNYNISDAGCVDSLAGNWIAFSVNDGYYEQFSGDDMFEKTKEHFPQGSNFVKGPEGAGLELERGKMNSEVTFNMHFPDSLDTHTYFPIKLSIFRYYFPNTPVVFYVFESS